MKTILFTFLLIFGTLTLFNAQNSQTPTTEQKRIINPVIDDGFTQWSKNWSYDRYVSRSAKITSISEDEDYGDIEASGYFTYKRLYTTFEGTFTAKINSSGRLVSITYIDAGGLRGSRTF